MAQAKAGPRKTSRTITLKLTEGEADLIAAVLAQVSGSKTRSPRKYAQRIARALEGALGYDFNGTDAFPLGLGEIEFRDYGSEPVTDEDRMIDFLMHVQDEPDVTVDGRGNVWTVFG